MAKAVVTGGTGSFGPSVVATLKATGHGVRVFARHIPRPGLLPVDAEVVLGDVANPGDLRGVLEGADVVVHLAALAHVRGQSAGLRQRMFEVNVTGTKNVVEAALDASVGRLVLASTVAVYGAAPGEVATEQTRPEPRGAYAESKLAAEAVVLDARARDGRPVGAVLRLAAIYGPRLRGSYRRLVRALARHRFIPVGHGANRQALVFVDDAARAVELASDHRAAVGRVFNVSDGRVHSTAALIETICESLGRRPPRLWLPQAPVDFAASTVDKLATLLHVGVPDSLEMVRKFTQDILVDSSRVQQELGFCPRFDLRAGWAATVREMRARGDL